MLKSYLKIALRNLLRHKGYSLINIAGLAVGIACTILILLFVQDELSYDTFHEKADRIYRLSREFFNQDGTSNLHLGHVAPPIAPLLRSDFPDIEAIARITDGGTPIIQHGDKSFQEEQFYFADPGVFDIFTLPFIAGDPGPALDNPTDVVLSESAARKYFDFEEDAVGQTITYNLPGYVKTDLKVVGVMKDIPHNSHFHFDFIGSMKALELAFGDDEFQSWGSNNYSTYLLLPEHLSATEMSQRLPGFIDRHYAAAILKFTGNPPTRPPHEMTKLHLWPLQDIHLHSQLDSEIEANGNIIYVYIFASVAFFVLLIACINFMNLATARSSSRLKEVGLRKVVGADRKRLILQFLGESTVLACIGLACALVLVQLVLPSFNNFVGKELVMDYLANPGLWLGLAGIALFVGVAAGSYPALYLSGFQPASVLKSNRSTSGGQGMLRKALVVFQFALSIILLVSVGVVSNQLEYCQNKDLGLNKEHVIVLPLGRELLPRFADIKNQLLQHPNIINVAGSKRVPSGRLLDSSTARRIDEGRDDLVDFRIANVRIDHGFLDTYGISLAAGRDLSTEFPTDSTQAFLLNETAVTRLGWSSPLDAIDKPFSYGNRKGKIIGVVKDFNYESLHQPITPIILYLRPESFNQVSVKVHPRQEGDLEAVIAFLREKWLAYRPDSPFTYSLLDQRYNDLYEDEHRLGTVFVSFASLAVFVACLGLFGLASYTAEQRTKEIGVRKVLGATVPNVVGLLTREFTLLVIVSAAIAWPVAYFAMKGWLGEFAYRININGEFGTFFLSGLLAFGIALLTVSYQAIRASLTDPVEALRYE